MCTLVHRYPQSTLWGAQQYFRYRAIAFKAGNCTQLEPDFQSAHRGFMDLEKTNSGELVSDKSRLPRRAKVHCDLGREGCSKINVMSRWSNLFGGGSSTDELPDTIESKRGTTGDSAFEVFIEGALTSIYNAASGRTQEQRRIRESCKKIIGARLSSPCHSRLDGGTDKTDC